MTFTQLYSNFLAPFIKTFTEAKNEKARKTVIKNAANSVKKAKDLLEDADDLPKELETVYIPLCFFPLLTHAYVVSGYNLLSKRGFEKGIWA
jgi:hypothetical protein